MVKKWFKNNASDIAAVGGLIFCLIFFTITTGMAGSSIWSVAKLSTLIADIIVTALMAIGAVFIYSLGNMDISIGRQIGLYSMLMVLIGNKTGNLWVPILVCLAIAVLIGVLNGAAGELLHIFPVITSVVVMMILTGVSTISFAVLNTRNIKLTAVDTSFCKSPILMAVVLLLEFAIVGYFFNFTKFGKYAKAIGSNKTAAAQCGINIIKYKVIAYVFLAVCLVTASLFQMGYTGAAADATGTGFEMNVMISLILGGMPLSGGMKSKISSALIGSFTFGLLDVGLPIIGLPTRLVFGVKSIIFLIVVLISCRKKDGLLPR